MEDLESSAYLSRNNLPIPAFTSLEVANKLRSQSEGRYINEYMESELQSYKVEIERRFKNSTINNRYVFPRNQEEKMHLNQKLSTKH